MHNIFDAPVYSVMSSIQAESKQLPCEQTSPVKRVTSYLSQTASSRLKSREPSASRLSVMNAKATSRMSQLNSPQKSSQVNLLLRKESPLKAA